VQSTMWMFFPWCVTWNGSAAGRFAMPRHAIGV
jgi:hypothetical protein